jgi:Enoyl-CoA hydratase/isomerase
MSNPRTGETIDAATAKDWGVVNEVVPHQRALGRGLEIATKLAAKPDLYRTLQKQTLNQRLRRRIVEGVPYGMALEGRRAQLHDWASHHPYDFWPSIRPVTARFGAADFSRRALRSAGRAGGS